MKMERRKFIKNSLIGTSMASTTFTNPFGSVTGDDREIFELRQYKLNDNSSREILYDHFQQSLIPVLNKHGVSHVGAYSSEKDNGSSIAYLLIPYKSPADFFSIPSRIEKDKDFVLNSKTYSDRPHNKPVFERISVKLMKGFEGMPFHNSNYSGSGIYELRTYEGYNEDAVRRKIKMFNEVELDIFKKVQFKPVFFGEVVAGDDLPCLTYMLAFRDMKERESIWDKFSSDPEWKKVKSAPEYANTVSKIHQDFLKPASFSQI